MKKICFVLLIGFITVALFAAGGSQRASAPSAGKSNFTFTGYPMNAKDQTISWTIIGPQYNNITYYSSWKDSPFYTGLIEKVGVTIDWSFSTEGTDEAQAGNLILASGEYPDIMAWSGWNQQAERYIDEGVIRDLTPYIKEWAPNYYAWLKSNPVYDRSLKTDSGKYWAFAHFREAGGWNDSYRGTFIRKDWLDANNLPPPATVADWDKTFQLFKEKYGAAFTAERTQLALGIAGAFGAYAGLNFNLYVDRNGKIQCGNISPEYKNFLAKMNEWWKKGFLDPDLFAETGATIRTKALNGKTGFIFAAMSQLSLYRQDAAAGKNGANWIGVQYPKGNDGTLVMVPGGYGFNTTTPSVVTTSCPDDKLELALRILDYGYTKEGMLFWNFNKQGVYWDYDAQGNINFLPIITHDPLGQNDAVNKLSAITGQGASIQMTRLIQLRNQPEAVAANDLFYYPNQAITSYYVIPPGTTFTVEESNRRANLQNQITTYAQEMITKFVTGEEPLTGFDGFVNRLNQMGLQELIKINQASYDRWLAR